MITHPHSCENTLEVLLPKIGSTAADFLQIALQIGVQFLQCVEVKSGFFLWSHIQHVQRRVGEVHLTAAQNVNSRRLNVAE